MKKEILEQVELIKEFSRYTPDQKLFVAWLIDEGFDKVITTSDIKQRFRFYDIFPVLTRMQYNDMIILAGEKKKVALKFTDEFKERWGKHDLPPV